MAINVGFDLFARADDFKELNRVFEPYVATDSRVMVDQDYGSFVGVGVEGFGQPGQLFLAKQTRRGKSLFQGIQHKPIDTWGPNEGGLFVSERAFGRFFLLERLPKMLSI